MLYNVILYFSMRDFLNPQWSEKYNGQIFLIFNANNNINIITIITNRPIFFISQNNNTFQSFNKMEHFKTALLSI